AAAHGRAAAGAGRGRARAAGTRARGDGDTRGPARVPLRGRGVRGAAGTGGGAARADADVPGLRTGDPAMHEATGMAGAGERSEARAGARAMRAAVLLRPGELELREAPVPEAGPGELVVRVE